MIGCDQALVIAHYAIDHHLTLKEAAITDGVAEDQCDRLVNPLALTQGGTADTPLGTA